MKKRTILAALAAVVLISPVMAGADDLDIILAILTETDNTLDTWHLSSFRFLENSKKLVDICNDSERAQIVEPFINFTEYLRRFSTNIIYSINGYKRLCASLNTADKSKNTGNLILIYSVYDDAFSHWKKLRAEYDALLDKLTQIASRYNFQL